MKNKIGFLFLVIAASVILTGCSSAGQSNNQAPEEVAKVEAVNSINDLEDDPEKTVIYFFWGDGCPHCAVEKPFLEQMEQKYPELEVKMFETWKNRDNAELFQEVAAAYNIQAQGVPTTFIGDFQPIVGYADYMAEDIEAKIKDCIENGCVNPSSKF